MIVVRHCVLPDVDACASIRTCMQWPIVCQVCGCVDKMFVLFIKRWTTVASLWAAWNSPPTWGWPWQRLYGMQCMKYVVQVIDCLTRLQSEQGRWMAVTRCALASFLESHSSCSLWKAGRCWSSPYTPARESLGNHATCNDVIVWTSGQPLATSVTDWQGRRELLKSRRNILPFAQIENWSGGKFSKAEQRCDYGRQRWPSRGEHRSSRAERAADEVSFAGRRSSGFSQPAVQREAAEESKPQNCVESCVGHRTNWPTVHYRRSVGSREVVFSGRDFGALWPDCWSESHREALGGGRDGAAQYRAHGGLRQAERFALRRADGARMLHSQRVDALGQKRGRGGAKATSGGLDRHVRFAHLRAHSHWLRQSDWKMQWGWAKESERGARDALGAQGVDAGRTNDWLGCCVCVAGIVEQC